MLNEPLLLSDAKEEKRSGRTNSKKDNSRERRNGDYSTLQARSSSVVAHSHQQRAGSRKDMYNDLSENYSHSAENSLEETVINIQNSDTQ